MRRSWHLEILRRPFGSLRACFAAQDQNSMMRPTGSRSSRISHLGSVVSITDDHAVDDEEDRIELAQAHSSGTVPTGTLSPPGAIETAATRATVDCR